MHLGFNQKHTKAEVFNYIETLLHALDLPIDRTDKQRPWGGFYAINESQAHNFCDAFFPELSFAAPLPNGTISPKILIIEPHKKLSWQYHDRRSELWKSIGGDVAVVTSDTDEQGAPSILQKYETLQLQRGQRHRLIGLEGWGIVAEIWQHSDRTCPSDENDIVRLEDDFGR